MTDPRNNPDDAYEAFMRMPRTEFLGLLASLIGGGVLTPAEQQGFERAVKDREPNSNPDRTTFAETNRTCKNRNNQ